MIEGKAVGSVPVHGTRDRWCLLVRLENGLDVGFGLGHQKASRRETRQITTIIFPGGGGCDSSYC